MSVSALAESHCVALFTKAKKEDYQSPFFAPGSSTSNNLRLMRNLEAIEPEVLTEMENFVRRTYIGTYMETANLAVGHSQAINGGSVKSRDIVYESLEYLIFFALRPIAHRIRSKEELEDYLQAGRTALFKQVEAIAKGPVERYASGPYWDKVLDNTRAIILTALRKELRVKYPVTNLPYADGYGWSFAELLFVFGTSPEAIRQIAAAQGRSVEEANEVLHNLIESEKAVGVLIFDEVPTRNHGVMAAMERDLTEFVSGMLISLTAKEERTIRLFYFENKTQTEIADIYGVSVTRVGKIIAKAERKMKHPSRWNRHINMEAGLASVLPGTEAVPYFDRGHFSGPRDHYYDVTARMEAQREADAKKEEEDRGFREREKLREKTAVTEKAARREERKFRRNMLYGYLEGIGMGEVMGNFFVEKSHYPGVKGGLWYGTQRLLALEYKMFPHVRDKWEEFHTNAENFFGVGVNRQEAGFFSTESKAVIEDLRKADFVEFVLEPIEHGIWANNIPLLRHYQRILTIEQNGREDLMSLYNELKTAGVPIPGPRKRIEESQLPFIGVLGDYLLLREVMLREIKEAIDEIPSLPEAPEMISGVAPLSETSTGKAQRPFRPKATPEKRVKSRRVLGGSRVF